MFGSRVRASFVDRGFVQSGNQYLGSVKPAFALKVTIKTPLKVTTKTPEQHVAFFES